MFVVRYTMYFAPGKGAPAEISVGSLTINDPDADSPSGATVQIIE
jgi:hypothetical protein